MSGTGSGRDPITLKRDPLHWTSKLTLRARHKYRWAEGYQSMTEKQKKSADATSRAAEEALAAAGGLISLVGGPDDPEAQETFRRLDVLLFGRGISYRDRYRKKYVEDRMDQWAEAATHIPADRDSVLRLAETVRVYEEAAARGRFQPLASASVPHVAEVVRVAVLVSPLAEQFVRAAERRWPDGPAQVFSERMVRELRLRLRGLLDPRGTRQRERERREGASSPGSRVRRVG